MGTRCKNNINQKSHSSPSISVNLASPRFFQRAPTRSVPPSKTTCTYTTSNLIPNHHQAHNLSITSKFYINHSRTTRSIKTNDINLAIPPLLSLPSLLQYPPQQTPRTHLRSNIRRLRRRITRKCASRAGATRARTRARTSTVQSRRARRSNNVQHIRRAARRDQRSRTSPQTTSLENHKADLSRGTVLAV